MLITGKMTETVARLWEVIIRGYYDTITRSNHYQCVHVVFRRQKYATVERHGGGYRVLAVPERHPFAVGFHFHYPQVLHGMAEAALLVRSHFDGFRGGVDGQP